MLVRAKLQFEGFDNATQPQKPHWESVRPVFALCHQNMLSELKNMLSEFGSQENKNENTQLLPVTGGFKISPFNLRIKLLVFHNCLKTSQLSQIMRKTSLFFT